jgi:Tfp pilus assembly protein PilF
MQATPAQQPAAGQAGAPQKNYKDRGEYDLYSKITQTQDPKARLDLLNQWQDKYPQSDYAPERTQLFVITLGALAQADPASRQMAIDKCSQILKTDPKNFRAAYVVALWGPAVGGTSSSPDLQTQVQTAAQAVIDNAPGAFDPSKKPAQMSQADFDKVKNQTLAIAHNALAWVATNKKDTATAENEYKASLEANPDQGNIPALYGKLLVDDKKVPEGLFEYAHAGEYTGPGALPEATRKQLLDYFNKAYKDFHGSMDGADQMLAQAKTAAVPPAGLTVTSQAAQAQAAADETNKRIASDPAFKMWYAIKQQLTGDQGDQFFNNSVKDTDVPGGSQGVKTFNGTVISIDPPDRPTKVVLGVEDPTKPDATLTFSKPLPTGALDKIKVGQKIDFSGVADSYTKDPYMLTFVDPTIPGVQTTAPAKTGRKRHR